MEFIPNGKAVKTIAIEANVREWLPGRSRVYGLLLNCK